jgi:hypothetical protein
MSAKLFNEVPFLSLNGVPYAEVGPHRQVIFVAVGTDETDCFDVDEASRLRDWLNLVIPEVQSHE